MRTFLVTIKQFLGLQENSSPPESNFHIDVALHTDPGQKRSSNEDSMLSVVPDDPRVLLKKGALFVVADGLGGHAKGEVASKLTIEAVRNIYYQEATIDVMAALEHAVQRANEVIYHQIDVADTTSYGAMGSTCVAAVLHEHTAYIANVGDSRAYIIHQGQARQITQDHSWVCEQIRRGRLTPDQAHEHEKRNIITRCLGTSQEVEVDTFVETLEEGDALLLCSDGLSNFVSEEELGTMVEQYEPQECVSRLVECANDRGGTDNITVIVARPCARSAAEPPCAADEDGEPDQQDA